MTGTVIGILTTTPTDQRAAVEVPSVAPGVTYPAVILEHVTGLTQGRYVLVAMTEAGVFVIGALPPS